MLCSAAAAAQRHAACVALLASVACVVLPASSAGHLDCALQHQPMLAYLCQSQVRGQ